MTVVRTRAHFTVLIFFLSFLNFAYIFHLALLHNNNNNNNNNNIRHFI